MTDLSPGLPDPIGYERWLAALRRRPVPEPVNAGRLAFDVYRVDTILHSADLTRICLSPPLVRSFAGAEFRDSELELDAGDFHDLEAELERLQELFFAWRFEALTTYNRARFDRLAAILPRRDRVLASFATGWRHAEGRLT